MNLSKGEINITYTVNSINASEEGMKEFLFTLGCFPGESITLLSHISSNFVINVKNARYSIDESLAGAIEVSEQDDMREIV